MHAILLSRPASHRRLLGFTVIFAFPVVGMPEATQERWMTPSVALAILSGAALVALVVAAITARTVHGRRIEAIRRIAEELRSVARGERESISPIPVAGLESLRGPFVEAAETIRRQRVLWREQEQALSEILNGMGEGLVAIDHEKRVVLANDRIAELFGVSRDLRGRMFYEVLRHSTLVTAFDHGLAGESFRDRAVALVAGRERQVEIRVVPVSGSSGIAAVALAIDVTQIEALARVRQEFVADFSHEVRTPLSGLRGSIESLAAGSLRPEQEEQLHRIIERQLSRLERLVSDLADLNAIESGDVVLNREPTELRQLMTDLAQDFFDRAEARKIAILVDGDETIAEVDPVRIEQVFSNLLDNAIKHAPESDEVLVDLIDGADASEIRVSDRGPGIPADEREKVFHRFYRLDKSRSSETAGTGLGLAITKHLVIRHGGSVSVESDLGRGTTFVVRLPKRQGRMPSRSFGDLSDSRVLS